MAGDDRGHGESIQTPGAGFFAKYFQVLSLSLSDLEILCKHMISLLRWLQFVSWTYA